MGEKTGINFEKILDETRLKTLNSIEKITAYDDLNIYTMNVEYDYDLDHLTPTEPLDTQKVMDLVFAEALPGIHVDYKAPDYGGCSVFTLPDANGEIRFGRNYDFKFDSSAMVVHCRPKNGYASVGHAALSHVMANDVFENDITRLAGLTAPFICIDGMNEKGVGIGVLTLDSDPVNQDTGKPKLMTTVLIRLILDKAASTAEAIELVKQYDMYALSGRDYHFYITDITGDSRIVEFDCHTQGRDMVVSETNAATNFYIKYKDRVLPNQKNGIYGHGRERYDTILKVLEENTANGKPPCDADGLEAAKKEFAAFKYCGGNDAAWQALRAAAQEPNEEYVTSNTQWSIVYNLSKLEYEIALHRRWDDVFKIGL